MKLILVCERWALDGFGRIRPGLVVLVLRSTFGLISWWVAVRRHRYRLHSTGDHAVRGLVGDSGCHQARAGRTIAVMVEVIVTALLVWLLPMLARTLGVPRAREWSWTRRSC